MIIAKVTFQDAAQMFVIEDDDVIKALTADNFQSPSPRMDSATGFAAQSGPPQCPFLEPEPGNTCHRFHPDRESDTAARHRRETFQ